MSGPLPDGERCYRYSVRCDRAFFLRLDVAARQAGMSVTSFVQAHFETILGAPDQRPRGFDLSTFDAFAFAGRQDISFAAARVWGQLRARADADGRVKASQADIAVWANVASKSVPRLMNMLVDGDLVVRIAPGGPTGAIYQVREPKP